MEEKELETMSQGETDHYWFVSYTYNYFRSLEKLSDTEHKEFIERLAENTGQFLLSQLRAKMWQSTGKHAFLSMWSKIGF